MRPTFSAALRDGPGVWIVTLRVTDDHGEISEDTATVAILNVAPTAHASVASQNVQYSDAIAGEVTFIANDVPADTMTASVSYSTNGRRVHRFTGM